MKYAYLYFQQKSQHVKEILTSQKTHLLDILLKEKRPLTEQKTASAYTLFELSRPCPVSMLLRSINIFIGNVSNFYCINFIKGIEVGNLLLKCV